MSLLSLENKLLLQLQQKQSFYDAVTEKYIAQKRRIELCYRQGWKHRLVINTLFSAFLLSIIADA